MDGACGFHFQLYVAGESANSILAINNLNHLCREHLPGCHAIEIVDIIEEPRRGMEQKVYLTPTLIKVSPAPMRRIVGNLGNVPVILEALGLDPKKI